MIISEDAYTCIFWWWREGLEYPLVGDDHLQDGCQLLVTCRVLCMGLLNYKYGVPDYCQIAVRTWLVWFWCHISSCCYLPVKQHRRYSFMRTCLEGL